MTHDERRWLTTVLIDNYNICKIVRSARLHELPVIVHPYSHFVQFGGTTVDALRIRNDQLDFLNEHLQTRTWIARRCDADLGVFDSRSSILIIYMGLLVTSLLGKKTFNSFVLSSSKSTTCFSFSASYRSSVGTFFPAKHDTKFFVHPHASASRIFCFFSYSSFCFPSNDLRYKYSFLRRISLRSILIING